MTHPRHTYPPSGDWAGLLSALIPGWGQYRQGRRRIGSWLLVLSGLLALLVCGAALLGPLGLVRALVDPEVLLAFGLMNIAVGVFRCVAVVDAWKAGSSRSSVILIGLLAFVIAPHLAIGWTQARTYTVLNAVFVAPDTTTTTTAPPTTTSSPGTTVQSTSSTSRVTTTTEPETTTTTSVWGERSHINLLLLGSDAGPGRSGVRTDTVIVASVNLDTGDLAIFGFPRNLAGLNFSDGTTHQGILNEVYAYGASQPDRFDGIDPGARALADVIGGISGIRIDYYMLVDLNAFVDLVDALGGVTMYIPQPLVDPIYPHEEGGTISIRIDAGVQELNGTEALAYVRSRRSSSDYNRMARQRCFLAAVAGQLKVGPLIRALPKLLTLVEENVKTDIPLEKLDDLIGLVEIVDADSALVVGFGPPDWNRGWAPGGYPIPDTELISEAARLILDDPSAARERLGVSDATSACGPPEDAAGP